MESVFAIETDRCERMLAVCFSIWDSEFSEYTRSLAEQTEFDLKYGNENTYGYHFFPENAMSLALLELTHGYPDISKNPMVNVLALYNAVWLQHPDYCAIYNVEEQAGLHDGLGMLLQSMGHDVELSGSAKNLIPLVENAGTDFLRF